jgi:hypothetical protein
MPSAIREAFFYGLFSKSFLTKGLFLKNKIVGMTGISELKTLSFNFRLIK